MFGSRRKTYLRSRKNIEERRRVRTRRILFFCGVVFLLITLAAWASWWEGFSIKEINIEGASVVSADAISKIVEGELDGRYVFIFSKRNALIYPKNTIRKHLESSLNRISEVDIFINDSELSVVIKERKPYALWCRENGDCYFMDKSGYIFSKAPRFTGYVFFTYYGMHTASSSPIGTFYTNEKEFETIYFFVTSLEDLGLRPVAYSIQEGGDSEVTIIKDKRVEGSFDGSILFNTADDPGVVYTNLETILSHEAFLEPGSAIDYIDLRFGNKVYYKLE